MPSALVPLNTTTPRNIAMDIVFVHGLNGQWKETWQKSDYTFWPNWLQSRFPMCRLWSFDYPAAASTWFGTGMALVDRARNFWNCLDAHSIGTHPIVFVTHSLGGLVTKALLRTIKDQDNPTYPNQILSNVAGIVFFATPHHGSFWASAGNTLSALISPTVTLQELQAGDRNLADLNTWFRTFASDTQLPLKVFAEAQPTLQFGLVVDPTSSDPGIPRVVPIPVDADHVSLCKFDTESDSTYMSVCKFIEDRLSDKRRSFANQSVNGLSVHLGVDNAPIGYDSVPLVASEEMTQRYKIQRRPDSIRIYSDIPYVNQFHRGGPVAAYDWTWTPFACAFPALDFKIANNTSEVVFISEAEFAITSSREDQRPVLVFRDRMLRAFGIVNEGSGTACDVRMQFNFQPLDEEPDFSGDYRHDIVTNDISDQTQIDITNELNRIKPDYPANIAEAIIASAKETSTILAAGQISWKNAADKDVHRCDFSTSVLLRSPPCGLPGPPTSIYDLRLQSNAEDYSETVPVSHYIKPGETDRFQIVLFSDVPSNHRFAVTLHSTSEPVFKSPLISLEYFVPASGKDRGHRRRPEYSK